MSAIIVKLCKRISEIPFPETSEELRLIILQLLRELIKTYPEAMENSLKEIGFMLSKCLTDAFPSAKKVRKSMENAGMFTTIYLIGSMQPDYRSWEKIPFKIGILLRAIRSFLSQQPSPSTL